MTEETGEWLKCVVDNDYEIWSEFPYPIRRKGSNNMIKESIDKKDHYVYCYLNRKRCLKHRIVAVQFLSNDDPINKTQVDHRNHCRTDNRIENLRWVKRSENNKNNVPETAEPLDAYNGHEFDGLWIDYEEQKLYLFNGIKYRELVACRDRGNIYYSVCDIENIQRKLSHKILFN